MNGIKPFTARFNRTDFSVFTTMKMRRLENDHGPGDEEEAFLFLPVGWVVWHRSVMEVHPILTRFDCTVDIFVWSLGLGPLNTTSESCKAALTAVRSCHTNNFLFYVQSFFNDFLEQLLSMCRSASSYIGFKCNLLRYLILLLSK